MKENLWSTNPENINPPKNLIFPKEPEVQKEVWRRMRLQLDSLPPELKDPAKTFLEMLHHKDAIIISLDIPHMTITFEIPGGSGKHQEIHHITIQEQDMEDSTEWIEEQRQMLHEINPSKIIFKIML